MHAAVRFQNRSALCFFPWCSPPSNDQRGTYPNVPKWRRMKQTWVLGTFQRWVVIGRVFFHPFQASGYHQGLVGFGFLLAFDALCRDTHLTRGRRHPKEGDEHLPPWAAQSQPFKRLEGAGHDQRHCWSTCRDKSTLSISSLAPAVTYFKLPPSVPDTNQHSDHFRTPGLLKAFVCWTLASSDRSQHYRTKSKRLPLGEKVLVLSQAGPVDLSSPHNISFGGA